MGQSCAMACILPWYAPHTGISVRGASIRLNYIPTNPLFNWLHRIGILSAPQPRRKDFCGQNFQRLKAETSSMCSKRRVLCVWLSIIWLLHTCWFGRGDYQTSAADRTVSKLERKINVWTNEIEEALSCAFTLPQIQPITPNQVNDDQNLPLPQGSNLSHRIR